jgi:hypothetical protein
MMEKQKSEPELFNYAVNLEKRVRATIRCAKSKRQLILDLCAKKEPTGR